MSEPRAALTLVQPPAPAPTPEQDLVRLRRNRCEAALQEAFVEMLELAGWQSTLEEIGDALDGYTQDARGWCRDEWNARAKAVYSLAEDKDLRGVE